MGATLTDPVQTFVDGRRMWLWPDGTALPVVSGGDGDEPIVDPVAQGDQTTNPDPKPDQQQAAGTNPADDATDDDEELGPAGVKALQALKDERKKLRADLAATRAELDEFKRAQMSDHERAVEEARQQARQEALADAHGRLFAAEVRAAAAAKMTETAIKDLLVDKEAAAKLLGFTDGFPVTGDGDIDSEAISQAVDAYVKARPYLAPNATSDPPPGDIDQGARTTATSGKSLAEQIAEAERNGDVLLTLALKEQMAAALPRP